MYNWNDFQMLIKVHSHSVSYASVCFVFIEKFLEFWQKSPAEYKPLTYQQNKYISAETINIIIIAF